MKKKRGEEMIEWLVDKEKDGEIFSNSYCLTYVIKMFVEENRVELWGLGKGMGKNFSTKEEAYQVYQYIKNQTYDSIWFEAEKKLK